MTALAIGDCDVWFPAGPQALYDVSLSVRPGEHWALLGANGAGKSTLLAIAGAQRFPSRGTVEILGQRLGRVDVRELRKQIGAVDPRLRVPPELTVSEYVATGATQTVQPLGPSSPDVAEYVGELCGRFGLADIAERAIGVCSAGERERARLARALVPRPRLLLLDEPAAGLDLPGRADLLRAIEDTAAAATEMASMIVVHHLEELPATTSHVALLRHGRLIAQGDVGLLSDAAALSECFGRPVKAFDVDGRWFASAT
ncbi:MAG TPA: ATP-binding cassette domain-containing protein [Mycobacteriales bacterium]|nr:ATP-binding cassette domain-containing protein [Mycobacteriales bacterium]